MPGLTTLALLNALYVSVAEWLLYALGILLFTGVVLSMIFVTAMLVIRDLHNVRRHKAAVLKMAVVKNKPQAMKRAA